MVVTNEFVFIRLQKCASRTLGEYFKKAYDSSSKVAGVHIPARDVQKWHPDKYLVCSIRNPWDWYVSWHTFIKNDERFESFYKPDFKDFLKGIFNKKHGRYSFIDFHSMNFCDYGVFSYRYLRMCCDEVSRDLINYWIRLENIDGMLTILNRKFKPIVEVKLKHMNKTNHKNYREYYDDELREMVAHKDRIIIDRFGYEF